MTEADSQSAVVLELAEEFLGRYRRGERPPLKEYVERYPHLEAEIREVFPAMALMERVAIADASLAGDATGPGPASSPPALTQLGDYRIIREVGRGGMGVVYEAEQLSLGRHVALKVLPGHGLLNPTFLERFRREAKAAARLHHTNIVPVFGTGEADGTHFYAMQFIRGEGLDRVLRDLCRLRRPGPNSPLSVSERGVRGERSAEADTLTLPLPPGPPPRSGEGGEEASSALSSVTRSGSEYFRSVARIGVQVADALAYAHKQGVLHRDIKPSNLLLDHQGTAWVTDFGLAKADGDDLTHTGDIVGTIRYMAPERFDGRSLPQGDVYSLGLTLYELLALRPAFDGSNRARLIEQVLRDPPARPRRFDPTVPRDLETVVLKCVAKDPKDRYATADELAEDLRRFLADRTIRARRATNAELAWRWCRRNPAVATLSTVFLLLLVAVSVASSVAAVRMNRLAADEQAARGDAEKAAAAERWERYRANVSAASSALWVQDAPAAGRYLDAAPEAHRNWEWRYLHAQLDGARAVLQVADGVGVGMQISPDGRWLASAHGRGEIRLWDPVTGRLYGVLVRRGERVWGFKFAPVGGLLAVALGLGADSAVIEVWDPAARRLVRAFPTRGRPLALDWTPDGRFLAAVADEPRERPKDCLVVWDIATGAEVVRMSAGDARVLAVRPDGRQLARDTGAAWGTWDLVAGREARAGGVPGAGLIQVAYSPDSRRLAAGFTHEFPRARLYDADTGRTLGTTEAHDNGVSSLAFSPDGTRLASGSMDQTVWLSDGLTGRPVARLRGHKGLVTSTTFTPDGRYLLSGSRDGTLRMWDGRTGQFVSVLNGHLGPVSAVIACPDGRTIASGSDDGTIRLWDTELAARNGVLTGHESYVYDVAVRPDGGQIASAAWDGTVRLWDPTTGRQTGRLGDPLPDAQKIAGGVAYSPDGRRLAVVYRNLGVAIWDPAAGTVIRRVQVPTGNWAEDPRAAFDPSGKLLAVGSDDRTAYLIDPEAGTVVATLRVASQKPVDATICRDVAFSPDGRLLAVTTFDGTVCLWDVATRAEVRVLGGHADWVFGVAFSSDGRRLASADRTGSVRIWDTATWQQLAELKHRGAVYALAWSPDGTRLAAGCADNACHLWDTATWQEVVELRGHTQYVHAITWSPDGTRLVTGSGDKTVRVWDSRSVHERAVNSPALEAGRQGGD